MRRLRYAVLGTTLGAVACASAPSATPTATPAATAARADESLAWAGSLQPMQERTGAAAPTKQQKAYGTVRFAPTGRDLNRTAVSIVVSTPFQEPISLRWAIVPGRCGSSALPLVGYEHFPAVEVGSNGRGQLTTEIAFAMPYEGAYHVNVYSGGGFQIDNVLTCANLRREGS